MNSESGNHDSGVGRVVFLLGKPARKQPLFPELFALLQARGKEVQVHLPHDSGTCLPPGVQRKDLLVQRGLFPEVLAELLPQEQSGLRFCNPVASTLAVNDRVVLRQRLQSAGLPIPAWQTTADWQEVIARSRENSLVVKALDGFIGRGAGVLFLEKGQCQAPADAPFPGPYLVEEQIAFDGWDRKLYIAGRNCRGLLKKWPRESGQSNQPFVLEPMLTDLALATGQALGLEIYGVDIILAQSGPLIVDVNVFPSFKGIAEAATLIADHICALADIKPVPA